MKTLFYTRKKSNGLLTIYCRLVDRQREAFSTNIEVKPENWLQIRQEITGSDLESKQAKARLARLKSKIQHEYDRLNYEGRYSIPRLKEVLLGHSDQELFLLQEFDEFILYHSEAGELRLSTLKNYKNVQGHLKAFMVRILHRSDIPLRELDRSFIARFWEFLRGKQRVGNNTSVKYLRNLKRVMKSFVQKGFIQHNPFQDYSQNYIQERMAHLTEAELLRLEQLDITCDRLNLVRDAFLFSCHTALAYTDLKNLREDHIQEGDIRMIKVLRQKTGVDSTVPVLPKAQEIIDKYAEHPLRIREGVIIPVPSNQKTNAYLKELAELALIKKHLTFHMARHTFGTTVTLSNNVPIETVSRMMGHSSLKMTQHYAKVLDAKIQADMLHLIHEQGNS